MKLRIAIILLAAVALSACGRSSRLPPLKPAPLTEISAQVNINLQWSANLSSSAASGFTTLVPAYEHDRIIVASQSGTVTAISKESGKKLWSASIDNGISAAAGLSADNAVIVDNDLNAMAFDSATGKLRWSTQLGKVVFAPPLVYQNRAFFKTIDGNLLALDANTGEILWEAFYDQPDFVAVGSVRPLAFANSVIVGNADGRIIATNVESGFETWQIYLASGGSGGLLNEVDPIPVVANDKLFVADASKAVVAYSLQTGNVLWENRRQADRWVAVSDTGVFGFDENDNLFALNVESGEVLWQHASFVHRKLTHITLWHGYVVVTDSQGYLHVLESSSGNIVGRARIGEGLNFDGLHVDNGRLYASFRTGSLKAYSLQRIQ